MPHRNRLTPCVCRPLTKPGPAEMPTTAMKTLKADRVMNHTVDEGIAPEERAHRAQPAEHQARHEGTTGGGQRQRHAADLEHESADQGAERDRATHEGDVGDVRRPIGHAQVLGGGRGVLRAADEREDVAAMNRRVGQHGNRRGRRPTRDRAQEDTAGRGPLGQLRERLAVDRLARHVDVDAFHRHAQQLGVLDSFAPSRSLARARRARRRPRSRRPRAAPCPRWRPRSSRCGGGAGRRRAHPAAAPRPHGPKPHDLAVRLDAEGAQLPAVPG